MFVYPRHGHVSGEMRNILAYSNEILIFFSLFLERYDFGISGM